MEMRVYYEPGVANQLVIAITHHNVISAKLLAVLALLTSLNVFVLIDRKNG